MRIKVKLAAQKPVVVSEKRTTPEKRVPSKTPKRGEEEGCFGRTSLINSLKQTAETRRMKTLKIETEAKRINKTIQGAKTKPQIILFLSRDGINQNPLSDRWLTQT